MIGEKNTTISRLRALLAKPSTEKTRKVLEQAGIKAPPKNSPPPNAPGPPKPGHGRNGAQAYGGARRIKIAHASLKRGDHCPECQKGKVYEQKEPALRIRVVGQAPLAATVYELERLRCNLCGEIFEAAAPASVGEKKYDETAATMIALLKYGTGRTITRRSPGGPAVPKANLNRKGMAWRWRDFSVGLYVPLLEFNLH